MHRKLSDLNAPEEKVLQWERHLLDPEVRSNPAELSAYLSEDFIEVAMNGQKYSRAEIIELVTESPEAQYQIRNSQVSLLSEGVALHLFDCLVTTSISGAQILTRRCSIWQQIASQWKLTFHQGTPAPEL